MSVEQAQLSDLPEIMSLIGDVVRNMNANGIDQWYDGYPNPEVMTADLEAGTCFCIRQDGSIVAIVTVNDVYDKEYDALNWLTPAGRSLYIHRLAVHPSFLGKGYAMRLMDWAEERVVSNGYLSMRLDTYTGNPGNVRYYERRNYTRIGEVGLKYRPLPFVCFEKLMTDQQQHGLSTK